MKFKIQNLNLKYLLKFKKKIERRLGHWLMTFQFGKPIGIPTTFDPPTLAIKRPNNQITNIVQLSKM